MVATRLPIDLLRLNRYDALVMRDKVLVAALLIVAVACGRSESRPAVHPATKPSAVSPAPPVTACSLDAIGGGAHILFDSAGAG